MTDNFLAQIKETEQKVADMISKAQKKKQDDFVKFKQNLLKQKEQDLQAAQEKIRQELQKSKLEARKKYEEKIAEKEVEIKKFESEKINMIDGLMGEAENLFLSLI